MGKNSKIQWATHSFNPWVGCTKVSPGCTHCYAEAYDKRIGGVPKHQRDPNKGEPQLRWGKGARRTRTSEAYWRQPLKWNHIAGELGERHRVFCASLADVFDPEVPREWRGDLYALIEKTPNLDWLLLTKRPEHIGDMAVRGCFPPNVWLGVTVENQEQANRRIPLLLEWPAAVRFLSCEPLLGPVVLPEFCACGCGKPAREAARESRYLNEEQAEASMRTTLGVDWVIIGGESGPKARPFNLEWASELVDQCEAKGVAPFVKQLGANAVWNYYEARRWADRNGFDPDEFEPLGWDLRDGQPPPFVDASFPTKDRSGGEPEEWPQHLRVRRLPEFAELPSTEIEQPSPPEPAAVKEESRAE